MTNPKPRSEFRPLPLPVVPRPLVASSSVLSVWARPNYAPDKSVYYRNEGNRHILSRGMPT